MCRRICSLCFVVSRECEGDVDDVEVDVLDEDEKATSFPRNWTHVIPDFSHSCVILRLVSSSQVSRAATSILYFIIHT
jgi:hypothetical protein